MQLAIARLLPPMEPHREHRRRAPASRGAAQRRNDQTHLDRRDGNPNDRGYENRQQPEEGAVGCGERQMEREKSSVGRMPSSQRGCHRSINQLTPKKPVYDENYADARLMRR